MVRASHTHLAITELGEVFVMDMHTEAMGDYTVENHVVVYETDRAIGWAPAPPGAEPPGHTWIFRLEPDGPDATVVTQTYDWSAVTDERLLPSLPLVDATQLAASLDLLAQALG